MTSEWACIESIPFIYKTAEEWIDWKELSPDKSEFVRVNINQYGEPKLVKMQRFDIIIQFAERNTFDYKLSVYFGGPWFTDERRTFYHLKTIIERACHSNTTNFLNSDRRKCTKEAAEWLVKFKKDLRMYFDYKSINAIADVINYWPGYYYNMNIREDEVSLYRVDGEKYKQAEKEFANL
jgi:hypothetical protein